MKITGIIWLEDIVEKLQRKHNVLQYEVREVLNNRPKFRLMEKGFRTDENVYSASGQSESGRYIIIFFIYKKNKRALILSARDMSNAEKKRYGRK